MSTKQSEIINNSSMVAERTFFLNKLKKNPIFLVRHLPALSRVMGSRYWTKLLSRLHGPYRASKKKPAWLTAIKVFSDQFVDIPVLQLHQNIPVRTLPRLAPLDTAEHADIAIWDLEDYLAKHRWGELIANLIEQAMYPHQHMPTFSPAIYRTIVDFNKQHGPAWETYSACERVANLLTWLGFQASQTLKNMPPATCLFLQASIQWIFRHCEYYGHNTNNHILNNARALIMGGVALKNKKSIQAGMLIFRNMCPILIQPNGALRERSTHYQLLILLWLLDAKLFLAKYPSSFLADIDFLESIILKVKKVAAAFCNRAGYLSALIGDVSPDASPHITAMRLLICHPQDWPYIDKNNQQDESLTQLLQYDDWHMLRNKQSHIILNCPQGHYPYSYPQHAHADHLSLVWLYQDQSILIDSGRARYTKDEISTLQKSAIGHNVPLVNGFAPLCESLVINGQWCPVPYAQANLVTEKIGKNRMIIRHNGFYRATPVKEHSRDIHLVSENQVIISDQFLGTGQIDLSIFWQLAPRFILAKRDNHQLTFLDKATELNIYQHEYALIHNCYSHLGWHSAEYGKAKQHPVVFFTIKLSLPCEVSFTFKVKKCVQ